jgi:hypothetical protein
MYVLIKYLWVKRKGMFLLEKVEVLDSFGQGMSTAVVRHQYGVHQSTITKISANISCVSYLPLSPKD